MMFLLLRWLRLLGQHFLDGKTRTSFPLMPSPAPLGEKWGAPHTGGCNPSHPDWGLPLTTQIRGGFQARCLNLLSGFLEVWVQLHTLLIFLSTARWRLLILSPWKEGGGLFVECESGSEWAYTCQRKWIFNISKHSHWLVSRCWLISFPKANELFCNPPLLLVKSSRFNKDYVRGSKGSLILH